MNDKDILNSELIKTRIAELEYGGENQIPLTEKDIRRIYVEETGKQIPAEIKIYHSDNYKDPNKLDSGFDGTIIHFLNVKEGINQIYTITRGSEHKEGGMDGENKSQETPLDWIYNAMGIFSGVNESQYVSAVEFENAVIKEVNKHVDNEIKMMRSKGSVVAKDLPLLKNGIGHSLGGNIIQMLNLTRGGYVNVVAINDAPPSAYQLAAIEFKFRFDLFNEFGLNINDFDQIYTIPPKDLKAFAESYYKEQGKNIHHLTNEEDMLFAASELRGFLDLGSRTMLDSNPEFESIRERIANLSDEDLYEMQKFLVKYAPAYKAGGYDGLVKAMTGIDLVLLQDLKSEWEGFSITDNPVDTLDSAWETMKKFDEMAVSLRDFIEQLPVLAENIPVIFSIFTDLTSEEISVIEGELAGMESDVIEIRSMITDLMSMSTMEDLLTLNPFTFFENIKDIKEQFEAIDSKINGLMDRFDKIFAAIDRAKLDFGAAVEGHSLQQVSNALAKKGRRYEGGNLILYKTGADGKKIEVNLSSSVRIYQRGMDSYEAREESLKRYRAAYDAVFLDDFETRKRHLLNQIQDMETNPRAFRSVFNLEDSEISSIQVHEHIPPLPPAFTDRMEEAVHHFQYQFDKGRRLVTSIKTSIEKMFNEEKDIAAIFELR
ncbi:DUF6792 domain-containing protein [Metabacillus indicus]|uniref:DUF6792 domain-containing protein n=1 Tax=Metabacillus indicus TaxID=246786 RepID=UPI00249145FA|nr:DUF6792 domain-containing protein [Metabacillus indicus]